MSISAEEKVCYLREAAIVLAKEGFQLDEVHTDRLCILLDGSPLCEVTGSGGVAYRNEDIDEPERIAAKDKVCMRLSGPQRSICSRWRWHPF